MTHCIDKQSNKGCAFLHMHSDVVIYILFENVYIGECYVILYTSHAIIKVRLYTPHILQIVQIL